MCDLMVLSVFLNSVKLLTSTIDVIASTYYDFNNVVNSFFAYQQMVRILEVLIFLECGLQ